MYIRNIGLVSSTKKLYKIFNASVVDVIITLRYCRISETVL